MKLQVRAATEIEKGESCYGAEISCAAEGYQLYRNNKNENKYIEVKKSKDGHTWMRQFMYWNTDKGAVKNYSGSKTNRGRYHRVTLDTLEKVLEDYTAVDEVHQEEDVLASQKISGSYPKLQSWPEKLTYEDFEEGDQIIETFTNVVGDLNLFEEPSGYGGQGTDCFYDDEGGELLAEIDLQEEQEQLEELYYSSISRSDFYDKVKQWMKDLCGLN